MTVKTSAVDVTAKSILFIDQEVFNRLLAHYKFEKFAGDTKEASESVLRLAGAHIRSLKNMA